MDHIKDFIIRTMPEAVVVLDRHMDIIFSNRRAEFFFKLHAIPDEVRTVCQRIFDAIDVSLYLRL